MTNRRAKASPAVSPKLITPGDYVLAGGRLAWLPGDWFWGLVLWADQADVLIEGVSADGKRFRQHLEIDCVRAVGTIDELVTIQEQARALTSSLHAAVRDGELQLGAARKALLDRVAELAKGGWKVTPPPVPAATEAAP